MSVPLSPPPFLLLRGNALQKLAFADLKWKIGNMHNEKCRGGNQLDPESELWQFGTAAFSYIFPPLEFAQNANPLDSLYRVCSSAT